MPLRLDRHLNSGIVMITGFLDSLYFFTFQDVYGWNITIWCRFYWIIFYFNGKLWMVLFTSFNDPVFISKDKFKWCNSSSDATVLLMIKANVSGYTRCGVDSHLSRTVCNFKKARATCIFRRFQIFTQRRLSNVMEVRKTTLEM